MARERTELEGALQARDEARVGKPGALASACQKASIGPAWRV